MPDGTAGPASMRPTLGASFRLGFENCVAERNRTKRGKCYDDLAAEHGFTPPAKTKIRSKWEQAKTASPIDDTETVVLTLESNEAVSEYLRRPSKPKLVLRCLEGETAAYLATETLAHNEPDHLQEAGLTLRFDKDPAVEVYAGESTDGRGFFLPDPESFMRRLTAHKQLVVRYVPFSAPPVVVTFDVGGLDPLLHDIARVCSWRKARRLEEPWNPPANIDTRGIPCTAAGECPGSATCLAGRCTAESGSLEEGEACRADDECEGRLRCDDARHRCRPPNERER